MSDTFDSFCDRDEIVVLRCTKPDCSWQHEVGWSDFEVSDGDSEARRVFMAHFNEAHPA